jgi:multidrug resistance efflux pump
LFEISDWNISGRTRALAGRMFMHLRPRLLLDALIAAVTLTIVGLTLFVFVQVPSHSRFAAHPNPTFGLPHIFQPIVIEVNGTVKSANLNEGSHAHRGDVLVQLETRELLLKKHTLERMIHFAEHRQTSTAKLYRELEETRVAIGRHTITSPGEGRILFSRPVEPGDVLRRGYAIAVQVVESQHAGHSLWPAVYR